MMSECYEQIHLAIQSYDENELSLYVARLAETAQRNNEAIEDLIVDLKSAVNSLPTSALRERARRELRDTLVRIAICAYYEGVDASTTRLARR